MRLELLERTLTDPQELDERAGVLPAVPLRNIGGDRCSCTPDLGRQTIKLIRGELRRQLVARNSDVHGLLPNQQVLVGSDRGLGWLAHFAHVPTCSPIRYS